MEPSKKYQPNIEPDIRPDLHVVKGGGESTPDRANLEAAQDLSNSEADAGSRFGVINGGGESTPDRANLTSVAKEAEQSTDNGFWAGKDENNSNKGSFGKKVAAIFTGKKAATGGIAGVIIGALTGISFFSAPSMLLVQVKEVLTNYGASSSRAANSQFEENLYYRLNAGTISACQKPGAISTIRCKRGTMSEKNYKKLVDSGFDVKSTKVGGRHILTSVSKDGIELNGKSSRAKVKNAMKHPDFGSSMRRASNWSTDVFNGGRFSSIVLKKFGLDKSKIELEGSNDEERKEHLNTLSGAADEDTDEKKKTKFDGKFGSKIKGVSKAGGGAAALGALGCSTYNMARVTLTAVRLYNAARFASFAILFLKAADQIKAEGEIEPETVALLGGVLTSYYMSGPQKGLTATDSQGYKVAAYGGESALSSYSEKFLLGGNTKLSTLNGTLDTVEDTVPGGKGTLKNGCGKLSDPLFGAGISAAMCGLIVAGGSGSGFIAGTVVPAAGNIIGAAGGAVVGVITCVVLQAAASLAFGAIMGKVFDYILPKIVDYLTDAPIDVNKIKGVDAGNALAVGAGVLMGDTNLSRGMQPGTKESVTAFQSQTAEDQANYDAIARYESKDEPFNAYNEHSFLGSFVRKSGLINLKSRSAISNVSTLFGAALSPISLSSTASALGTSIKVTENDLSHCPDKSLREIGVDCDVMGGIQYTMTTDMPEKENLDFMVGTHVDESGEPTSDVYKKWVESCTDHRTDPIGSTMVGIEDEDDWATGEACVANSGKGINQTTRDQFSTYYYRNAAVEDEEYVPPANVQQAEGSTVINIASFNVRGKSHDGEKGTVNYKTRMKRTVATIQSEGFDVIGFQEFETKQREEFNNSSLSSTYTLSSNIADEDNGNAIAWNSAKYELVDQGTQPDLLYTVGNKLKAPWVKLREKSGGSSSGREFYFLNTHDPANVHDDPPSKNAPRRTQNAEQHVKFMKEKAAEGIPVFITGDFNSGFDKRKPDTNVTPDNIKTTLPYCIMTSDGSILNAFDTYKSRDAKCPNGDIDWAKEDPGKGCSTQIDHLYYTSEVLPVDIAAFGCVKKGDKVDTVESGNGSDHDTVKFQVTINGDDEGSSGDIAWPVDEKYFKLDRADFLGAHFAGSGTWTNGVNSLAADIGSPPDGSNVYAMLGGIVSRPYLKSSGSSVHHGLAIQSKVSGGVVEIAYAHGPRANSKTSYNAGEKIMEIGCLGNCDGGHVHIDMSFTPTGGSKKGICPQDIFLALDKKETINWNKLAEKAAAPCGRS